MKRVRRPLAIAIASAAALGAPSAAEAVYLNADGLGQALIYPYYTVRSVNGNAFNTFVSVVNHTPDAKVVRVRFLEALNARSVQSFNVYLSPNDVWTGAVVPLGTEGTRVIAIDTSCTNGAFDNTELGVPGRTFQNVFYAGSNTDGLGEGLDRTREGYLEMIEMATLTGASAAAVTHRATGFPFDCSVVQGTPVLQLGAPSGGLSGSLTLINVNNGADFTVNAEALAELSTQAFYREPADPYVGFEAAEITPVSLVSTGGRIYRSVWTRGVDAVSAALMRAAAFGEYVLDDATRSRSDVVVTMPTRRHYVSGGSGAAPFDATGPDRMGILTFNRETRGLNVPTCFGGEAGEICGAFWKSPVSVFTLSNGQPHTASPAGVLGSQSHLGFLNSGGQPVIRSGQIPTSSGFSSGWLSLSTARNPAMTSLPTSTRIDVATGQTLPGAHMMMGLPMVGFTLRTFENGTLSCSAGTCQGNYGGSFPLKFRRAVSAGPTP